MRIKRNNNQNNKKNKNLYKKKNEHISIYYLIGI